MANHSEYPDLTLWRKNGACSIAAHMLLHELNIPFKDMPMVDTSSGIGYQPADPEFTREDFLRMNPSGYVPVLQVDGEVITELSAILYYIAGLVPDRHMVGGSSMEKARVLEWMSWLSVTLNEYGFAGLWAPQRMVGREASLEVTAAVKAEGKETILKAFAQIELKLEGRLFAVGSHLTVIDMMLHTFWRWGTLAMLDMEQYTRLKQIAQRLETLDSVKRVLLKEALPLSFDP